MRINIIYEDSDIIVIQKPAGIAVQTAQVGRPDVVSELKNYLAALPKPGKIGRKAPYLGISHRLDQPVEGLLVFAKNPKAAAELSAQLAKEDFCKEYLAVVCGKPAADSGELVDYLLKEGLAARVCGNVSAETAGSRQDTKQNSSKGAGSAKADEPKRAVLHYERKETMQVEGEEISLLQIRLQTGRFHQIRVQLSHAGYPILGDAKYGNERSRQASAQAGIRNTALCAYRLRFKHPVQKKVMEYTVIPAGEAFTYFKI